MNQLENIFNVIYANPYYVIILTTWGIAWKGIALWRASHRQQKYWFIALLVINTMGLLEIFYIYLLPKIEERVANKKTLTSPRKK